MRQFSATIIQTPENIQRYSTVIIPGNYSNQTVIRTTSIDRLDRIAYDFYQDATLWWVIAAANNLGKGSLLVPVNTKLVIPNNINLNEVIKEYNKNR